MIDNQNRPQEAENGAADATPADPGAADAAVPAETAVPALEKFPPQQARFRIGDIVRHRIFAFRGVIFDVDPVFNNSEEWWLSIPEEARPDKNQPFYHLLAENDEIAYIAYVSQQNLEHDEDPEPIHHPAVHQIFQSYEGGRYQLRPISRN